MIQIDGAEQLVRLAKNLKETANKDAQKKLNQAAFRATKLMKVGIRRSLATMPPKRGGLAKRAAATKLTTRRRTSGKAAGVRVVGTGTVSLYHMNRGEIRHRKGGDINAGKVQRMEPGVWDKPAEAAAPQARLEMVRAMTEIEREIVRGV